MKEKLIIKNFGPIKNVELELGRFNVMIGENSTAKSTVVKVLAVCRYFSYILGDEFSPNAFEDGLNLWGLAEFIQNDSYIRYECKHYSFIAKRGLKKEVDRNEDGSINYEIEKHTFSSTLASKSKEFENLLKELSDINPNKSESHYNYFDIEWTIPTSFFLKDVAAVLDSPFYVPTERGLQSIFSLGKNSIRNLSDSLFNQLAELDQMANEFKKETNIEPLDITYKNEKGYIKKETDDKYYSLFNAASGYKSTIPVVLLVKSYSEIRKKRKTFIIEEPELNLFPIAQDKLMKYLVAKTMNYGNDILLATHSPYILTSLNNLMYAYYVGQNHPEEVKNLIDKSYWLNPSETCAYRLLKDGTAKDILDDELKLIEAGELDEISRSINEIFDGITNIEYSTVE